MPARNYTVTLGVPAGGCAVLAVLDTEMIEGQVSACGSVGWHKGARLPHDPAVPILLLLLLLWNTPLCI